MKLFYIRLVWPTLTICDDADDEGVSPRTCMPPFLCTLLLEGGRREGETESRMKRREGRREKMRAGGREGEMEGH